MTSLYEPLFPHLLGCVRVWDQAGHHPVGVPPSSTPGCVGLARGEELCHPEGVQVGLVCPPTRRAQGPERGPR